MGSPISLYFVASILVSDAPSKITSWRDHLEEAHRWLFATLALGALFGILRAVFVLDDQFRPIVFAVLLVPLLVGAIVRNRTVHIGAVVWGWANVLLLVRESFRAGS